MRLYHAEWELAASSKRDRRAPLTKRLGELSRTIERLVDAICDGTATPAMKARLVALEADKEAVEAQLAEIGEDNPITLHPRAAERFAEQVRELQARLSEVTNGATSPDDRKVIDAVRCLVEKIEITPTSQAKGAPFNLTLHGRVAEFMEGRNTARTACGFGLVAGGGIEPPTCGL